MSSWGGLWYHMVPWYTYAWPLEVLSVLFSKGIHTHAFMVMVINRILLLHLDRYQPKTAGAPWLIRVKGPLLFGWSILPSVFCHFFGQSQKSINSFESQQSVHLFHPSIHHVGRPGPGPAHSGRQWILLNFSQEWLKGFWVQNKLSTHKQVFW